MKTIGIIANPASGKDIRRLVSHATVVDNNEKVNIVKRIILAAQGLGLDRIYIMPDTFLIGYKAVENLTLSKELIIPVEILDMPVKGDLRDSTNAAARMVELGVSCVIVMGGDGTSRAVAKSIGTTPLIPISTGTNNVYPEMIEGTVAGLAAAVLASGKVRIDRVCKRDKRIEVFKDNKLLDIALIDCVISKKAYVGSKAIWNTEDIQRVIVSRASPAAIGFSTIVGVKVIVDCQDDWGASINVNQGDNLLLAPIAAGTMRSIRVDEAIYHGLDEEFSFHADYNGTIALDGEREILFKKGDDLSFKISRSGPIRVDIRGTIEEAQRKGFFTMNWRR